LTSEKKTSLLWKQNHFHVFFNIYIKLTARNVYKKNISIRFIFVLRYTLFKFNFEFIKLIAHGWWIYGVQHHFQQYVCYIVAISFIGGGNRRTQKKPQTCRKSLTKFITLY